MRKVREEKIAREERIARKESQGVKRGSFQIGKEVGREFGYGLERGQAE